jgi:hypothetical protein
MKKALFLFLALTIVGKYAFAQDGENDLKNFRFGLKTTGMLTWYKPDDKKKFSSGGVSAKGSYGLMTEFRLNKVAVIATGIQVDYDGGKLNMLDTNYYFINKDSELLSKSDTAGQQFTMLRLGSRQYNTTYLTLPLTLKLKTNEIGMLTYYGQFGINASFRLKDRVNDETYLGNLKSNQTDLENTKDMNLFKFALNVGGGAEWNLSGSTSLVFGLNWYNGFSNVLQKNSDILFRSASHQYEPTVQNARASAIALTFGVLF